MRLMSDASITTGTVLERLDMPPGIGVSGLGSDGHDRFFCGGGKSVKSEGHPPTGKQDAISWTIAPLKSRDMAKLTLTISALYLAGIGLALMFFPLQFGRGAVPTDASPELLALLRLLGGPFLGIAVLNWLSRDVEPSARPAVILANLVGFGGVAANDIWGVASGEAREIAKIFLVVHLLFAFAFLAIARSWRRVHD
jgi:hypothetical protein